MTETKKRKKAREGGRMVLNIRTIGQILKAEEPVSRIQDPFSDLYGGRDAIISPPYSPLQLAQMVEISDILQQCISAMATNVDGFGYELIRPEFMKEEVTDQKEAQKEKKRLEGLFDYCNPTENFTILRQKLRVDLESTGNGYIEVVRNRGGEVSELYLLPAYTVRMTQTDKEWTPFTQRVLDPETGQYVEVSRKKKFRRYVQILSGNKKVFFKEFGDPRVISAKTGGEIQGGDAANEVLVFKIYSPYSVYGLPRWLGTLLGLIGSRKAEEINYLYFDNKTIPPLVITVSGGALTGETIDKLEDTINKQIRGTRNFHSALILEAVPHSASIIEGEKVTPVRIEVKPLTQFIQKDALFGQYRKDNSAAIRSTFRLPPLYVGKAEDYTRATAMESARVAEEQVFEPERRAFDYAINRTLLADMEINYWRFKSLGGKTSDDADIVKGMAGVKEAIPIGIILEAVADMRNVPVGDIPQELYHIPLGALMSGMAELPEWGEEATEKSVRYLMKVRERLTSYIEKRRKSEE